MKLMVQCPQVNHHLLLSLRELMTCDECSFILLLKYAHAWEMDVLLHIQRICNKPVINKKVSLLCGNIIN